MQTFNQSREAGYPAVLEFLCARASQNRAGDGDISVREMLLFARPHCTPEEMADLELLLAHLLDTERQKLILVHQEILSQSQKQALEEGLARLADATPIHYLINRKNFMGLDFFVDERVLIPRFDTEVLVEAALQEVDALYRERKIEAEEGKGGVEGLPVSGDPSSESAPRMAESAAPPLAPLRILELCTGSGAIAVSLAHLIPAEIPVEIVAVDISPAALEVAARNREALLSETQKARLTLLESDLFAALPGVAGNSSGSEANVDQTQRWPFDMLVANPPYISAQEYDQLEEKVRREPRLALLAEEEGLYFYRRILEEGKYYLSPGGRVLLEIGATQWPALEEMAQRLKWTETVLLSDFAGLPRVVKTKKT